MVDDLGLGDCRVAVIATGRLGRACGRRLEAAGAVVALLDLDARTAEGDWDAAAHLAGALLEEWGRIDVVVNELVGLGDSAPPRPFADEDPAAIASTVARSLGVVVSVTRAMLDVMIPAGRGRIVNVVTERGGRGRTGRVVQDAGHAAVVGLTRNLAEELPDIGVTVVAVAVGAGADPARVADAVAFLASSAGSDVHGTAVCVSGVGPA